MPKCETEGFYDAKIEKASFNLEFRTFECTARNTESGECPGEHVYPSLYLENRGGGQNTESFDKLQALFGWNGEDGDDLIQRAIGKTVRVGVSAKKGDKKGYYYNFCKPSEKKEKAPPPAAKDVNSWLTNLRCGISNTAPVAAGGGGSADLSIAEENIPFSPCK